MANWRQKSDFKAALRRRSALTEGIDFTGEPGWDRTIDLLIKSQLLYR
jgi:hypothetical protein